MHDKQASVVNGAQYGVYENIKAEKSILKRLSAIDGAHHGIVRYVDFFKSHRNYYLILEHGGDSLFDFTQRAHQFIAVGQLSVSEWHRLVRVIWKQMVRAVAFLHSRGVCHFDISLENWLIADIKIMVDDKQRITFCTDNISVKLCDFGLADVCRDERSWKFAGKPNYFGPEVTSQQQDGFDARANDVWCLGVCLFMLCVGGGPFERSSMDDESFKMIMSGEMEKLLYAWGRKMYVTTGLLTLFGEVFRVEKRRCTVRRLLECEW